MRTSLILLLLLFNLIVTAQSNSYEKAWKALNENNRSEAEKFLIEAEKDPATFQDAYISRLYLNTYNGKVNKPSDFADVFYKKADNPYPYIFSLWFNQAVLGLAGKKSYDHQLKLIDQLISDNKAPGTLVASSNYQKGVHYLFINQFEKAQTYFDAVGNIRNWQYVGPFENLSESGFYKNYGPIEHPEPQAVFKSLTNADIKWTTPASETKEGWIPVVNQFNRQTAVVYAQNFISSPVDQTVYVTAGVKGSFKLWMNDELLISESKERETDMDTYVVKYELKKGVSRILIQLGFTSSAYPNFTVRITDERFRQIKNIAGSPTYTSYPKNVNINRKYALEPHFAEAFFEQKVSNQHGNLVNYLLLADVYLRSRKLIEARNLLTEAIERAPQNCLLKMKLIEVLTKEDNRTLLLEEIEKIKQADPESLFVIDLNLQEFYNNKKFEDGAKELEKRIRLHGEDEITAAYKITFLANDKKYDEMVKEAEKMFNKYPENEKLVSFMYAIKKEVYKDNKGALNIYENYLKGNLNYSVISQYLNALAEQGNNEKVLAIKEKLAKVFPYSPLEFYNLAKYFYDTKNYKKAEENVYKTLTLAPTNENYWELLGDVKSEQNNIEEALEAYNQSLNYDPNQYTLINKIRKLKGKPETFRLFSEVDVTRLIKDDKVSEAKNTDYGYYYILDQKDIVMHPGGATEEYYTIIIKITNEKGVETFKESTIPYNSSQNLFIEKAEIVKKNDSKIEGERNENEIVFTKLEAGDVLVFKYHTQSYVYGRFMKEYWDRHQFGGQIYSSISRYNLLLPANVKINYVLNNSTLQPTIRPVEDFKLYSWEMLKAEPQKDEPLMPELVDVGTVLHISTIASWKDISGWYSDISNNKAEEDFEVIEVYKKLFPPGQKPMTQSQKAKIIYDYIAENINYSHVSFRQSAYVPQRAASTLTTRLGDCKDLSSLFVTLAQMAGIKAQMVLVDTRDNGEKDILLPCIEFNHCIVKAIFDDKAYYIELTNDKLPILSLPYDLKGALILETPSKSLTGGSELRHLLTENKTKDIIKRKMDIKPANGDLNVQVTTTEYGSRSSGTRYTYRELEYDKQLKEMEKKVAVGYKNNVNLEEVKFYNLDKLYDSVSYTTKFKVKNEVAEIGSLKTFRINYPDLIASMDNFSSDTREYPVEYWSYEDVDEYETIVTVTAPTGTKFIEVPGSESFSFKDLKFSIQYTLKEPGKLTIVRKFSNGRKNIPASDYPAFKNFFEKIVKAEQKFLAYK